MTTLLDWEKHHHEPEIWHYPKIMDFLSYCPYQSVTTLGDFVLTYRVYRLDWSQKEMAKAIGIDPATLARIEGNHGNRVYKSSVERITTFLRKRDCAVVFQADVKTLHEDREPSAIPKEMKRSDPNLKKHG